MLLTKLKCAKINYYKIAASKSCFTTKVLSWVFKLYFIGITSSVICQTIKLKLELSKLIVNLSKCLFNNILEGV